MGKRFSLDRLASGDLEFSDQDEEFGRVVPMPPRPAAGAFAEALESDEPESRWNTIPDLLTLPASRFEGKAPPTQWLIEGKIPLGVPVILAAPGDSGKSFILLDLCLSVALGPYTLNPMEDRS
ncbi:AAA family ATPase [Magnetofaba australis]|uniref:AAA family ATPase n=1 Tax=Magnetofaba australis TaxID=1472297 RepID=UPI000A19CBFB|nr:AAA family ATPase [Magnetofaba australis]